MAKISANGNHKIAQVKASKDESPEFAALTFDGKVHMTLTVTSDGRVLRKIGYKRKTYGGGHRWDYSGNKILTRSGTLTGLPREEIERRLGRLARKMGYTPE
jgi:hypothetical protein